MRRTYMSKKDAASVIDRRDLFQNLGEKSSAYDAFSIQNIKQTKREISCVGTRVASSRVRKKKYVKRIVKEIETPCRESMSQSTYLTPDKSIHVNKPLDPFDLLLMSSPVNSAMPNNEESRTSQETESLFYKCEFKKQGKKYYRKKPKKITRINNSSTDSLDSDKENSDKRSLLNCNTSDIRFHKFLVEPEDNLISKTIDDSINHIVNNLSLLNKLKNKNSNESVNKTFKINEHRLTRNIHPPLSAESPLCSTPFKKKVRTDSIFKFSPIPAGNEDNKQKFRDKILDNSYNDRADQSIFGICPSFLELQPNNIIENKINSTELYLDKEVSTKIVLPDMEKSHLFKDNIAFDSSAGIDPYQCTEIEPFLGFSQNTIAEVTSYPIENINNGDDSLLNNTFSKIKELDVIKNEVAECDNILQEKYQNSDTSLKLNTSIISVEENYKNQKDKYETIHTMSEHILGKVYIDNTGDDGDSIILSMQSESIELTQKNDMKSSHFPSNTVNYVPEIEVISSKKTTEFATEIEISESDHISLDHKYNSNQNATRIANCANCEKRLVEEDQDNSSISEQEILLNISVNKQSSGDNNINNFISDDSMSQSVDKYSLYDTCTSEQSFIQEGFKRVPLVVIQKMSNSLLYKYNFYRNNVSLESEHSNSDKAEDNLENSINVFADIQCNNCTFESDNDLEIGEEKYLFENEPDNYNNHVECNCDEDSTNEEEMCVSFVTTRRRNEITNNSIMSIFDNSYYSSSTDCNETVVSNDIERQNSVVNEYVTDNNITLKDLDVNVTPAEEFAVNKNSGAGPTIHEDPRISFVTLDRKKSMRTSKKSITNRNSTILTEKPTLHQENFVQDCEISSINNVTIIDLDASVTRDEELFINKDSIINEEPRISFITLDRKKPVISSKKSISHRNSSKLTEKPTIAQEKINQGYEGSSITSFETKPGIVLKPGKKWERSLSIYRRMTMMNDHFNKSILDEETTKTKGRKYRQSVISTIEMQDLNGSLHNESISSRRSTFVSKPSRSTIRIVKDSNSSRLSLCNTTVLDDLKGFWNEECDDTIIELSKLSIADQSHEVTVIDNFHDTSNRIATARDYVLRRCNQTDSILFDECYPDADLKNCHKIGEGVYGEVFLWRDRDGIARVLKIVPIAGSIKVNGESQKNFHEIISEIVIAMELSALRAPIAEIDRHFDGGKDVDALDLHDIENATDVFNEVLAVRCVYGSYPSRLLDLWDLYDECKGSENDNPAILPVDQQYIVLELANAGQDLESYQFNNAEQAHALFLQVAYGLAVAEEAFQFEHRDLHWGNVLISPTDQKYATFVIRGRAVRVARCGVRGAIIDYSLSRAALPLPAGDSAALYNDLAGDDSLFDALGDYQFEVYRLMRDKLRNEWQNFEPYTNILWLHYTVDKMITALRYKRTNTKIHKHYIDKLKRIKGRILGYGSAAQFVLTDNEI